MDLVNELDYLLAHEDDKSVGNIEADSLERYLGHVIIR